MSRGGRVRVGLSGWSYPSWRGRFYPDGLPARRQLEYVAERLGSVEINGSFYSLQRASSYRAWRDATPRDFVFAVKGSRFISHNLKLGDARAALANFFASGVLCLRDRLGPILWQLPPQLRFEPTRLRAFFDLLPRDTIAAAELAREHDDRVPDPWVETDARRRIRYAIEPRHESFFGPGFAALARRKSIAIAFADSGDWPYTEELTAGFVYLRLHGSPRTYASRYSPAAIDRWADRIEIWRSGGEPGDARRLTDRPAPRRARRDVFVYFDNDHDAHAPGNALELCERLGLAREDRARNPERESRARRGEERKGTGPSQEPRRESRKRKSPRRGGGSSQGRGSGPDTSGPPTRPSSRSRPAGPSDPASPRTRHDRSRKGS